MKYLLYIFLALPMLSQGQTLVAHWDFNGTTNDVTGNGLNGTGVNLTSTAGYSGIPNTAYAFNGSSSKIDVPYNSLMNLSSWSITALIKPLGYYSSVCQSNCILSRGHEYTDDYYALYFLDNPYDNSCSLFTPDSEVLQPMPAGNIANYNGYKSGQFIHLNTWYCVASTYGNDTIKVYINGVLTASIYWPSQYGNGSTGALCMGYYNYGLPTFPYWFNGIMDDVRLYSGVMTTFQIDSLCDYLQANIDTTIVYDFNSTINCNTVDLAAAYVSGNNASQYSWSFGDNTTASGNPVSHVYASGGTYVVTLIVTDAAGHTDTISHSVTVSTGNFNYTITNSVTSCRTIQLNANYINGDTSTQFLWNFGDNSPTVTGNPVSHTYSQSGTYTVSLVLMNSLGCTDTLTSTVNITTNINYSTSFTQLDCKTAQLTASYLGGDTTTQYTWLFGDNSPVGTGNPVTHIFPQNGTYLVKLAVMNSQGCTDTISMPVTLTVDINYSIADSVVNCKTVKLTASHTSGDTAAQFLWLFSDNTTATGNPVTHVFNQNGTYTATLVASNSQGCADTFVHTFTLPVDIRYTITDSGIDCRTAQLSATYLGGDTAVQFQWLFANGDTASSNPVIHTFPQTGANTAGLVLINTLGCRDTMSHDFTILYQLFADFTFIPDPPEKNTPVQFHNASSPAAIKYSWDFGDSTRSTEQDPLKLFTKAGVHEVCLTVTDSNDCSATACKNILADVTEIIDIPDAFSPNGDGINDVLFARGFGVGTMTLSIYNRWGQKIFTGTELNRGWDGTYKGKQQPDEVYVYVLDAIFLSGKTFHKQGNVTILR